MPGYLSEPSTTSLIQPCLETFQGLRNIYSSYSSPDIQTTINVYQGSPDEILSPDSHILSILLVLAMA